MNSRVLVSGAVVLPPAAGSIAAARSSDRRRALGHPRAGTYEITVADDADAGARCE